MNDDVLNAIPDTQRRAWPRDWQGADEDDDGKGIRCPKCGCRDLRVTHVRNAPDGSRWRRRVCRHCGTARNTYER
jgi:hypothetical protein